MSKPVNKSKTYFKMGAFASVIVCFATIVISIICFRYAKQQIVIPVVSDSVGGGTGVLGEGKVIRESDIGYTSVGRYGLSDKIITDPSVLVGKYTLRDYRSGEYFFSTSLSQDYPKLLAQKIRYGALAIPTSLIGSVNAEIMPDDFIKIDVILSKDKDTDLSSYNVQGNNGGLPDSGVSIIHADDLQAVRVVGFYDAGGFDITRTKLQNSMTSDPSQQQGVSPGFLILDVTPIQEALLIQGMYGGTLQIIIMPDEIQRQHKLEWGLIDEQGNKLNYMSDDEQEASKKEAELQKSIDQATQIEQQRMNGETLEYDASQLENGTEATLDNNENTASTDNQVDTSTEQPTQLPDGQDFGAGTVDNSDVTMSLPAEDGTR